MSHPFTSYSDRADLWFDIHLMQNTEFHDYLCIVIKLGEHENVLKWGNQVYDLIKILCIYHFEQNA